MAIFDEGAAPRAPTRPIAMRYCEGAEERNGVLAIHESQRYALLGRADASSENCVKRILGRTPLINEGIRDDCQVDVSGRKRNAKPAHLAGREFKLVLVHRLRFYFTALYLGLAAGAASGTYWLYDQPQRAELAAQVATADLPGLFDLREQLFARDRRQGRPAILLAASGGGTRAALYTYSVLGGLHDLGVLEDVVLASGVSGGSAAIAYFAMHRADLLKADPTSRPPSPGATECLDDPETCRGWARFGAIMSAPFIQDALRGLTEWRMAWGCEGKDAGSREGVRLGVQLQESFDRWYAGAGENGPVYTDGCADPSTWSGPTERVVRFGDQTKLGLIFNTALAGRFDSALFCRSGQKCDGLTLAELEHKAAENDRGYRTSAHGKGGRLILTNLKVVRNDGNGPEGPFPDDGDGLAAAPGDYLTYKVVNAPAIPLVSAAALSANFPPVFPNAAVDVDGQSRYWVTDGGATDNRGIISLLYALEGAINAEIDCRAGAQVPPMAAASDSGVGESASGPSRSCGQPGERSYPPIHIVMAEASATDPTYSQDRGITTTFGAAERFASQLMVDKLKQLAKLYERRLGGDGIYLHKLAMPLTLRSAGGIGTHWMLPAHLTLREPAGLRDHPAGEFKEGGVRWPVSPDAVKRFLRFSPPGVDMSGAQAKRLVEALHWFPSSPADAGRRCVSDERGEGPSACEDVEKVWERWICNDPQQPPYPQGWQCLARTLAPAGAGGAENVDTGCPAVATQACAATRVTWTGGD